MEKKRIFSDNVGMETQSCFYVDGIITIQPCEFELGQHIVNGMGAVIQRGRMTTQVNGASCFRPFATGTGHRYRTLHRTPHGEVKETNEQIIVQLRFPKKLGKEIIAELLAEESEEMLEWINSRETETRW